VYIRDTVSMESLQKEKCLRRSFCFRKKSKRSLLFQNFLPKVLASLRQRGSVWQSRVCHRCAAHGLVGLIINFYRHAPAISNPLFPTAVLSQCYLQTDITYIYICAISRNMTTFKVFANRQSLLYD